MMGKRVRKIERNALDVEEKTIKSEKAYEKVVAYIKQEIWQGSLKRGDSLPPERDLAQLLGVSRNSVREALRTMSLMGFISSVQGAGNFVSCNLENNLSESIRMMMLLGETNYMQISQLRRGMESEMVLLAAARITPKQTARLLELARQMKREENAEKASRLDQQYHNLLCEACGNKLIQAIYSAMVSTVDEFIGTMYVRIVADPEKRDRLLDAHEEIAEALQRREGPAAEQAMQKHFRVVDETIRQMGG